MYYESDSQQEMGAYSMKNKAAIVSGTFTLMDFIFAYFIRLHSRHKKMQDKMKY
jgi:hypothetical protein